jgi:archaellum component FlaC
MKKKRRFKHNKLTEQELPPPPPPPARVQSGQNYGSVFPHLPPRQQGDQAEIDRADVKDLMSKMSRAQYGLSGESQKIHRDLIFLEQSVKKAESVFFHLKKDNLPSMVHRGQKLHQLLEPTMLMNKLKNKFDQVYQMAQTPQQQDAKRILESTVKSSKKLEEYIGLVEKYAKKLNSLKRDLELGKPGIEDIHNELLRDEQVLLQMKESLEVMARQP